MILTAGVLTVRHFIMSPYEHGVQLLSMILTGYMPLTLWRHITNQGIFFSGETSGFHIIATSAFIDTFLAMVVRELGGITAALIVVYGVLLAAGAIEPVADWGLLLLGWLCDGRFCHRG